MITLFLLLLFLIDSFSFHFVFYLLHLCVWFFCPMKREYDKFRKRVTLCFFCLNIYVCFCVYVCRSHIFFFFFFLLCRYHCSCHVSALIFVFPFFFFFFGARLIFMHRPFFRCVCVYMYSLLAFVVVIIGHFFVLMYV